MSNDVYYIRTGDKISKPFKIGFMTRTLFLTFFIYTSWVTYEFFKILWLQDQIEKLQESTEAKYRVIAQYDDAMKDFEVISKNHSSVSDVFEIYRSIEDNHAKPNQQ